jgi:hypothetical protein
MGEPVDATGVGAIDTASLIATLACHLMAYHTGAHKATRKPVI